MLLTITIPDPPLAYAPFASLHNLDSLPEELLLEEADYTPYPSARAILDDVDCITGTNTTK